MIFIDQNKEQIINDYLSQNTQIGFLVQAGPGTGKTTLLSKLIEKIITEEGDLGKKSILIMSHVNSSIDSIITKLSKVDIFLGKNNIKTISSFFIENYLSFLSTALLNSDIMLTTNQKRFLNKIGKDFGESDILDDEWRIFHSIIHDSLANDNFFDIFYQNLIKNGIKYIFIDEYQDTENLHIAIIQKMINKGTIKFFLVGDKNQQINYSDIITSFINLESKELKTTYRFGKDILENLNKVLNSGIENYDNTIISNFHKDLTNDNRTENGIYNLIEYLFSFIKTNKETFLNKINVILFQPSSDYTYGKRFNTIFMNKCNSDSEIKFICTEKPFYNYHMIKFISNLIKFIQGNLSINYSTDIENHLKFFYKIEDKKTLFNSIIGLKNQDNIIFIKNILNSIYFKKNIDKDSYNLICDALVLRFGTISNINIEENKDILISGLSSEDDNIIYFSTNTINSAKGKEYDNVILLNIVNNRGNITTFTNDCINNEQTKRLYYVGISRARENIFIFN